MQVVLVKCYTLCKLSTWISKQQTQKMSFRKADAGFSYFQNSIYTAPGIFSFFLFPDSVSVEKNRWDVLNPTNLLFSKQGKRKSVASFVVSEQIVISSKEPFTSQTIK